MSGGVSKKSPSSGLYRRARHSAAIDNHFKAPQKVECMSIIFTKHVKVDQQGATSRRTKDSNYFVLEMSEQYTLFFYFIWHARVSI